MASNPSEKVLQLIREAGVLRPRALDKYRIPRIYLLRLYRAGRIKDWAAVYTDLRKSRLRVEKILPKRVRGFLAGLFACFPHLPSMSSQRKCRTKSGWPSR